MLIHIISLKVSWYLLYVVVNSSQTVPLAYTLCGCIYHCTTTARLRIDKNVKWLYRAFKECFTPQLVNGVRAQDLSIWMLYSMEVYAITRFIRGEGEKSCTFESWLVTEAKHRTTHPLEATHWWKSEKSNQDWGLTMDSRHFIP